jgi:hypothetical protein
MIPLKHRADRSLSGRVAIVTGAGTQGGIHLPKS